MEKHKIVTTRNSDFFFGRCVPLCGLQCLEIGWNIWAFWGIWQDVELAVHPFTISGEKRNVMVNEMVKYFWF